MITKAEIQAVRSLHDKTGRSEYSLFIAEGVKIVEEIISSDLEIAAIYVVDSKVDSAPKIITTHRAFVEVSQKDMSRISALKSPTFVLAVIRIPNYGDIEVNANSLIIALDKIQDPGNLGTIIRLADWFGIDRVLCSMDCVDLYSPKVIQASMGAILRVKVQYVDLVSKLSDIKSQGLPIYGTFLEGDNVYDMELSHKGVIVMGNEGQGVSADIQSLVTEKLYIPPFPVDSPSSESLNVAIATAIICFEFRRRV